MKIRIQDFNVWFGSRQILKDITLNFKPGIISAIIGPSGCGKTTLLKAINRTAELAQGFKFKGGISLDNTALYDAGDPAVVRRTIGMVFQKPVVLPLSIKENVLFGPRYYGFGNGSLLEELAHTCLTQVGLYDEVKDKLDQPADQLSGGQQQRLSIARVLAVKPEVLLLDEPCSSLDIVSTKLIESLLVKLSAKYPIILVTHNLAQAKRIAGETFFMSNGRLVEYGSTYQLFNAPACTATQDFLATEKL